MHNWHWCMWENSIIFHFLGWVSFFTYQKRFCFSPFTMEQWSSFKSSKLREIELVCLFKCLSTTSRSRASNGKSRVEHYWYLAMDAKRNSALFVGCSSSPYGIDDITYSPNYFGNRNIDLYPLMFTAGNESSWSNPSYKCKWMGFILPIQIGPMWVKISPLLSKEEFQYGAVRLRP